jgi:hypothetical protein
MSKPTGIAQLARVQGQGLVKCANMDRGAPQSDDCPVYANADKLYRKAGRLALRSDRILFEHAAGPREREHLGTCAGRPQRLEAGQTGAATAVE